MTRFSIFLWNANFIGSVFSNICNFYNCEPPLHGCALRDILELWFLKHTIHVIHCYVPLFVHWCIWLCRNKSIFEDKPAMILDTLHQIYLFLHWALWHRAGDCSKKTWSLHEFMHLTGMSIAHNKEWAWTKKEIIARKSMNSRKVALAIQF